MSEVFEQESVAFSDAMAYSKKDRGELTIFLFS